MRCFLFPRHLSPALPSLLHKAFPGMFLKICAFALVGTVAGHATCTAESTDLDQAYRSMYNLDFSAAQQQLQEWEQSHPAEPLGPVSEAASYLFAELDRLGSLQSQLFLNDQRFENRKQLAPDSQTKTSFQDAINRATALATKKLAQEPSSATAMLSETLAYGLEADYAALIEKHDTQALGYIKQGRHWAQSALGSDSMCYDAYLALGVENYLLGVKPVVVRAFLRLGGAHVDKDKGLDELQVTAEKGQLLKPFARLLLAVAALRDRDVVKATRLLQGLREEFPGNPLYSQELAKLESKPS
jgi:hypothetical protein